MIPIDSTAVEPTDREARAIEQRLAPPGRRCTDCRAILSRYNRDTLCMPCSLHAATWIPDDVVPHTELIPAPIPAIERPAPKRRRPVHRVYDCAVCGEPAIGISTKRRYCSDRCRAVAFGARKKQRA